MLWAMRVGFILAFCLIASLLLQRIDIFRSIDKIAEKYGFAIEQHDVPTEDGYINVLHRVKILNESNLKSPFTFFQVKRPVILFLHGFADSSDTWAVNGPEKSPAFFFTEQGYDIWIANFRCTHYSWWSNNQALKYQTGDVSIDCLMRNMAQYDFPAFIQHIKE